MARRLLLAETIQRQDSAERAVNKLARTFTTQMEALKRYRTGGEQQIVVKRVTVNSGGQAIVGNVSHGTSVNEAPSGPALLTAGDEVSISIPSAPDQEALVVEGGAA